MDEHTESVKRRQAMIDRVEDIQYTASYFRQSEPEYLRTPIKSSFKRILDTKIRTIKKKRNKTQNEFRYI